MSIFSDLRADPYLATLLAILVVGLLATIVPSGIIIFYNRESENLVLAFGTLFGAAIFFGVQLYFALQPETTAASFGAEYVIDRAVPKIYRSKVGSEGSVALLISSAESRASDSLQKAAVSPLLDIGNVSSVASDFTIFSIVSFLVLQETDWQQKTTTVRGSTITFYSTQRLSHPDDCTKLTPQDIASRLHKSGNLFGGAKEMPSLGVDVCFPPHTHFEITRDSVIITNSVCRLTFHTRFFGATFMDPKPHNGLILESPKLKDGSPQFATVQVAIDLEEHFFPLRAQR
jgi:hypothetical protein